MTVLPPTFEKLQPADVQAVVFYPTFGRLDEDDRTWSIAVRGAVYRPPRVNLRRKLMLRLLRRLMRARKSDLESEVFRRRIHGFLVAGQRGEQIAVRVGSQIHVLQKKSRRNGHFGGTLRLSAEEAGRLERSGQLRDGWLRFHVVAPRGDFHGPAGCAQLIGRTGVSVVSDIDDTIKHSDVTRRRTLLTNTFLREFRTIPGMPQLYRRWASQGAAFHYVSSSPWQLYGPLAELCRSAGMPSGTFHLRGIRMRDSSFLRRLVARRWRKRQVIASILKAFPLRQFVLVGDSGERDPEIYGALARRFPDQVARIFIRDLPAKPVDPERREKAFRKIPRGVWRVFHEPAEIEDLLPNSPEFGGFTDPRPKSWRLRLRNMRKS